MNKKVKIKKTISTFIKFIKISPIKVQRIFNFIRNKTYKEALMCLEFMPYKACFFIWTILFNTISNIQKNCNNKNEFLRISKAIIFKGPIVKKINYIARGRCNILKKKTCHIKLSISII